MVWNGRGWARTSIVSAVVLASAANSLAQETKHGNFELPAGAATCPVGTLGHVEKRGSGPVPVILFPGAGFGWDAWESFMERNGQKYTMYAVTPAGYGDTPAPTLPENPEDFTLTPWTDGLMDGIAGLIQKERMERPVVIGHHLLGGYYAALFGLRHPELVRGVVVLAGELMRPAGKVGGPNTSADEQLRGVHEKWVPFFRTVAPEKFRANQYSARMLSSDPARGADLYRRETSAPLAVQLRYFLEFNRTNIVGEVKASKTPTLAVLVERDPSAMIQMVAQQSGSEEKARAMLLEKFGSEEAMRRALSGDGIWESVKGASESVRVEYLPPGGLFVMDDRPEDVDRLVGGFVAGLK